MTSNDCLEIIPLGGLGEFGMNMMAFRYRESVIIVDCGVMFPRDELLGVDLVIPEFDYLLERREEIRAVFLTHGHEDHIGSLAFLLKEIEDVPVYGTALTLGFAKGRLAEQGVLEYADLNEVEARDTVEVDDFVVEFLAMTHSVPDAVGLAVTTPVGTVVHTGDFKFDQAPPDQRPSDYARLSGLGERGILALLSDSTNSERRGYTGSESDVRNSLEEIFNTSRKKMVVACFASSIHRIQIIMELAAKFRRRVVPIGRSMIQNIAIARELGYLRIADYILADARAAEGLAPEQILLLSTGAQGEPGAGLARLALGKHKEFSIEPEDTVVFSARTIPGNEVRISHLINHFARRGARVYDESYASVHVSGHASREELKLMMNLIRPRFFIPIHGEYRQLFNHAQIAREIGIPKERILMAETGDIICLRPDTATIEGRAPVGRRLIDAGGIAELDELVVRDRQRLSVEGVVLAVIPINKSTGHMEGVPELVSRGHVQEDGGTVLLSEAREVVIKTLEESTKEERIDSLVLTDMVRADLKRFFRKRTATRPMIIPVILEI